MNHSEINPSSFDRIVRLRIRCANVLALGALLGMTAHASADLTGSPVLAWKQTYDGPPSTEGGSDSAVQVAADPSGDIIVTGTTNAGSWTGFHTIKYAATDGAVLWSRGYNGSTNCNDEANAVVLDEDNNVIVTGSSRGGQHIKRP